MTDPIPTEATEARPRPARRRGVGPFSLRQVTIAIVAMMAAAIVGGAIHHEEKVAAGAEAGAQPLQYKQTLQGPLAALGDAIQPAVEVKVLECAQLAVDEGLVAEPVFTADGGHCAKNTVDGIAGMGQG